MTIDNSAGKLNSPFEPAGKTASERSASEGMGSFPVIQTAGARSNPSLTRVAILVTKQRTARRNRGSS